MEDSGAKGKIQQLELLSWPPLNCIEMLGYKGRDTFRDMGWGRGMFSDSFVSKSQDF